MPPSPPPRPALPLARHAWPGDAFAKVLKTELEALPAGTLPLDHGVAPGSRVDDSRITVCVLASAAGEGSIRARIGVFFSEIVGSCGCGAEPLEENAYCELDVRIDMATARAEFKALSG